MIEFKKNLPLVWLRLSVFLLFVAFWLSTEASFSFNTFSGEFEFESDFTFTGDEAKGEFCFCSENLNESFGIYVFIFYFYLNFYRMLNKKQTPMTNLPLLDYILSIFKILWQSLCIQVTPFYSEQTAYDWFVLSKVSERAVKMVAKG